MSLLLHPKNKNIDGILNQIKGHCLIWRGASDLDVEPEIIADGSNRTRLEHIRSGVMGSLKLLVKELDKAFDDAIRKEKE